MKKNTELAAVLCPNFCAYYKPGKNEELACEGFLAVGRLIEKGQKVPLGKRPPSPSSPASAAGLREVLCRACPFHEADCDFILTNGKAAPCGGFVLLSHLLEAGDITLDEIKSHCAPHPTLSP